VLCVVWRHPGEYRRGDCAIALSVMVLVNNLVCCGVNISRQFPLKAKICAMIVVFIDVCLRVGTWVKGSRRKKADFLFNCRA
jgi:hypothetical protein